MLRLPLRRKSDSGQMAVGFRLPGGILLALGGVVPLTGCFSLTPVPPPEGLPPLTGSPLPAARFPGGASDLVPSEWERAIVFVRPRLDGHDVGWFVLDTGASGWTIAPQAAASAGLEAVAWTTIQGRDRTTVYRCERVEVGCAVISPLFLSGLAMRNARSAFGRDVAGICGHELLSVAVVELDGQADTVRVLPPEAIDASERVRWMPVEFHAGLPHVRCRYPDGSEGLFVLDTGCDQAVYCFGPAADAHGLRAYATGGHRTQIAYGSRQRVDNAVLPAFGFGDQEFGPVDAVLGPPDDAAARILPQADGVIGVPLWRHHRLLLDFGRARVAMDEPSLSRDPTPR